MASKDVRKDFLFNLISCYHGKFDQTKYLDDKHLNDFLEDTNCLLLVACVDSSNQVHLTSKVSFFHNYHNKAQSTLSAVIKYWIA